MDTLDTLDQSLDTAYIDIKAKIAELEQQLLASHPAMPTLLRTIHTQIKNDPACVTTLTESEIHIIVQGLEKQTNTYLAESISKKPSAAKSKALSKTSIDDLF